MTEKHSKSLRLVETAPTFGTYSVVTRPSGLAGIFGSSSSPTGHPFYELQRFKVIPHSNQIPGKNSPLFHPFMTPSFPQTAPAGISSKSNIALPAINSPISSPHLSRATQKQNYKLNALLNMLNENVGEATSPSFTANRLHRTAGANNPRYYEGRKDFSNSFEKNLQEVYGLIDTARTITDTSNNNDGRDMRSRTEEQKSDASKKKKPKKPSSSESPTLAKRTIGMGGGNAVTADTNRGMNGTQMNQTMSQQQRLDDADKRTAAGRRPVRAIMQDLAKRLQILRINKVEWEALQIKIASYRHAEEARKGASYEVNKIAVNKAMVKRKVLEKKQEDLKYHRQRVADHRAQVLKTKKQMDEFNRQRKERELQEKLEHAANVMSNGGGIGRFQQLQMKWFIIVTVASRIRLLQKSLADIHERAARYERQTRAAVIIQRAYKTFKEKQLLELQKNALVVIGRVFSVFLGKWRVQRRREAADLIMKFFKEVYDVSKLLKIVKKYRYSVVKAQRYSRAFLAIRNAQVHALGLYWNKLEPAWWTQRLRGSQQELDEKKDAKKKKVGGSKKKDAGDKKSSLEKHIRINEDIKKKILLDDLVVRRKAYHVIERDYLTKLSQFNDEAKKRLFVNRQEEEQKPPSVPLFKLLPTPRDMYVMMDQAFMETLRHSGHDV